MSANMLFFFIFGFIFGVATADYCPPYYTAVPDQGICVVVDIPTVNDGSFDSASHQCAMNGAFLPNISNVFVNNVFASFANKLGQTSDFFIGVVKNDAGVWTYSDGSTLIYSRWAVGEPNNQYSCAIMNNSTYWYARDCHQSTSYACMTYLQSNPPNCPSNWVPFGDSCYYLKPIQLNDDGNWILYNFTDAQENCVEMGSQLASIHSKAESDFVYDLVYAQFVNETDPGYNRPCDWGWTWIGLAHSPSPNTTYWLDGTSLDYCDFGTGDCVIAEMYNCGFEIHNDATCYPEKPKTWGWWLAGFHYSRYLCKKSMKLI
ncbi:unnamed protein product, partial [Mesorhabditis belari]|uniref:C-type lectin domain-containing protein n=1 Tax=Mesorhabditis belari TaxID=2138241 RepID=A0AAF3ELG9_9BILA